MRRCLLMLALTLLGSAELRAQQSSKVSYEGQRVATVDLIANPKISVDSVRPLVQLKPGDTFQQKKVQATIEAMRKTGNFSKVEIGVKPDAAGLHVTFTLEPALYFGVFDFPGATKQFSYTRLLQVVDIPDQTAYKEETVAEAGGALLKFLVAAGFFQAQVRSEPLFDEQHLLANVTFHINLGKRAKVGKVTVVGPPQPEATRLAQQTKSLRATFTRSALKAGKSYTPRRINAAVGLIRRDLANRKRLASRVDFDHSEYHPDTNRADVFIRANEGPIVNIDVTGAKLSVFPFLGGRRKKQLIPIFSERAVDPDLVDEGQRNLADFFQKKGYFDVKVTTTFRNEPDKVTLIYNIDKRRRHSVAEVNFRGNRHIDEDDLEPAVAVKPHHFFSKGKFSEKLLAQSVKSITAVYKDRGYEEVKVETDVVDREPKIYVTFQVTEGPQTLVDNLNIQGNKQLGAELLAPKGGFRLSPGQAFSAKGLSADRSSIMAAYLDRGFLNAEFDSNISRDANDPTHVDVTYKIAEKQQVHINDVVLLGAHKTRPTLISKTANIRREFPLSQGNMLQAESDLYQLGIFDWNNVNSRRPITDQADEDVLVQVHEAKRNTLTYGFGLEIARRGGNLPSGTIAVPGLPPVSTGGATFTSNENTFVSPRGSVEYTRNNVRGLGELWSISALMSRLDQRLVTSYTDPHFRYSSWNSLTSISVERTTENPVFAARLAEGSWQLEKPLNKDKTRRIQLRYRFRRTVLSDLIVPGLVLPQDTRVRLSTLSATWIRDTRDKPLDAHKGFYETLDLGITPKALGSSANFARVLGQSSYYQPFGKNLVWANRITLGFLKSFAGSSVPTSERFFSGGETTLRGFSINAAGPQRTVRACAKLAVPSTCVNLQVPIGGNQLFVLNSEWRFPLGIKENLGGVVFYDGGNVYRAVNLNDFVRNYTNTVGVGVRYSTPVGPIRVDIGRNLNPIPGVKRTQFFITLGQAF
jgi:outer membrane protein insertion porin family